MTQVAPRFGVQSRYCLLLRLVGAWVVDFRPDFSVDMRLLSVEPEHWSRSVLSSLTV